MLGIQALVFTILVCALHATKSRFCNKKVRLADNTLKGEILEWSDTWEKEEENLEVRCGGLDSQDQPGAADLCQAVQDFKYAIDEVLSDPQNGLHKKSDGYRAGLA